MKFNLTTYLFLLFFLCTGINVFSHALHPDSMDRHAEITFTADKFILIYQAICGLNPTETYTRRLDPDNDDIITDEERTTFVNKIEKEYAIKQVIRFGDENGKIEFHSGDAYASIGHNGMHVIKVDIAYIGTYPANMPRNTTLDFSYEDQNFTEVPGWKQMQVGIRNGVVYDGHIPYREYKPFDYEIIATKGFTPGTEKITGKVNIPSPDNTTSSEISLPERIEPPEIQYQADIIVTIVAYGLAGLFALIMALVVFHFVRQRMSSH